MPRYHHLLIALLPLFAGCQLLAPEQPSPAPNTSRLQGEISLKNDQLLFKPCHEDRKFALMGPKTEELNQQARTLIQDRPSLFVDLSGHMQTSTDKALAGQIEVTRLYRLQGEGHTCSDPNFEKLLLRASGHEPEWNLNVSSSGMVLERPGVPALALPYLEEQMPDGRFFLSTAADGLNLSLWLTPTQCTDNMTGAVQHLSAELRIDDQTLQGCAAFGAKRND